MKLKNLLIGLSVPVFIIGITVLVFSFVIQIAEPVDFTNKSLDVKVNYVYRRVPKDGTPEILRKKVSRLQKADGSWKETVTAYEPDGSIRGSFVQYAVLGRGVIMVSEKNKKLMLSGYVAEQKPVYSAEKARTSSDFVRDDSVLNFKTQVFRIKENDTDYREIYRAPDLSGLWIKMVEIREDYLYVIEATEIKVEKISDEEYGKLPDYPMDDSSYNKAIDAFEKTGNKEMVNTMKKNHP